MNNRIKDFIHDEIENINNDNWVIIEEKLHYNLTSSDIGEFYYMMVDAGLNPIKDLNHIPRYFLAGSPIKEFIVPDDVTLIEQWAFSECPKLSRLTIGKKIKVIEDGAITYCPNLTEVKFNGTKEEWSKINNPYLFTGSMVDHIKCIDGEIIVEE